MKSACLIVLSILILSIPVTAHAQATRTWVSGVGDDVNPCSRTAPCKTFAGAISKTAANGYIHVLDPGGYGTLNITKSITVDGGGFMAGALASGTTGFIINGAGITVNLRNIDIEGANSGFNGIRILNASKVTIDNCNIFGFNAAAPNGNGISIDTIASSPTSIYIRDTTISGNSNHGIRATTAAVITKVILDNTSSVQNGQSGMALVSNVQAELMRSTLAQNGASGLVFEQATSSADIYQSAINNNGVGITTVAANQARLFASQLVHNTTSISAAGGVQTHGNNAIPAGTQPATSVTPAAANGQQ